MRRTTQAIEILEEVRRTNPLDVTARSFLCQAYVVRATLRDNSTRFAEAAADWDRAMSLTSGPADYFSLAMVLSMSLARAGNHKHASHWADLGDPGKGEAQAYLARVYSVSLAAAARDESLSAEMRKALTDQYAAKAISLLRRAARRNLPQR